MLSRDALTIEKIRAAMRSTETIPATEVKAWMCNAPVEVMALLTRLVLKRSRQINPPLPLEEICDLLRNYYQQALSQENSNDLIPPRSISGHELVRWFRSLWNDPSVPKTHLLDLKLMLSELYKSGDPQLRDTLVNSVFEHLFETPEIVEFFHDWRSDPLMADAFRRGLEWSHKSPTGL